jgi:regulator of sirC expression with transglutaminase-like and TPR domain
MQILQDTCWTATQSWRRICFLDALNETMFEEKGFRGNSAHYYNPANSYIDQVLRH